MLSIALLWLPSLCVCVCTQHGKTPASKTWNQEDDIAINRGWKTSLQVMRTVSGAVVGNYHFLVIGTHRDWVAGQFKNILLNNFQTDSVLILKKLFFSVHHPSLEHLD